MYKRNVQECTDCIPAAWLQHEFSTVSETGFVSLSFTTTSEAHPFEDKSATKITVILPLTKFTIKGETFLEAHLSFQGLPFQVYTDYFCPEFSSQKEEERLLCFLNMLVFTPYQGSPSDFKAQRRFTQKRKMSC